jgi:hypothetical protein
MTLRVLGRYVNRVAYAPLAIKGPGGKPVLTTATWTGAGLVTSQLPQRLGPLTPPRAWQYRRTHHPAPSWAGLSFGPG